jgi:tRNA threonylcarbamoyladenosine biosynthesis protein TsaE
VEHHRSAEPGAATRRSLVLRSPSATRRLGRKLGALLQPGDFVALTGELGVGKTLFVRGATEGAGVPEEERATSPTFALVHLYRGGRVPLQHFDLYRLAGAADLFALGFDDLLAQPAATLCEWADRAGDQLPVERLELALTVAGPRSREAELRAHGTRAETLLAALAPRSR